MINAIEDVRNEFKVKLTDKFEEEVISFLNTNGGNIYIGVNDNRDIVGVNGNIDLLQRTIKDRIKDNIMPSTLGLYDVVILEENNKKYIKVIIARGSDVSLELVVQYKVCLMIWLIIELIKEQELR